MTDYNKFMKKCISLAKKGNGKTAPNPMVGCIVLDKNDNIISTGYHHKYGENHAERDALLKLKNGEEKDGTLIVNLEPCTHYGKTPPCADLIIERGIKKYGEANLEGIDIELDGDYVNLHYHITPVPFQRIRRITGYLVGTLDRFNDAKRDEVESRVKHMKAN